MSSAKVTPLSIGRVEGVILDFEAPGDVLARHAHEEGAVHISIVARGALIARGDGWQITMGAGGIYEWAPGQFHEFEALEPNSRIVNIRF